MNNKEKITKNKLNKDDIGKISGGILAPTLINKYPVDYSKENGIKYTYILNKYLPEDPTYHSFMFEGEYDTFDEAMKHAYDIEKDATERNSVTSEGLDKFLSELPK